MLYETAWVYVLKYQIQSVIVWNWTHRCINDADKQQVQMYDEKENRTKNISGKIYFEVICSHITRHWKPLIMLASHWYSVSRDVEQGAVEQHVIDMLCHEYLNVFGEPFIFLFQDPNKRDSSWKNISMIFYHRHLHTHTYFMDLRISGQS